MDLEGNETIIFLSQDGLEFLEGNIKVSTRNLAYHLEKSIVKAGLFVLYKDSLVCRVNKDGKWYKGKLEMKIDFIPDQEPIDYQI